MKRKPLSEDALNLVAQRFKVLSEPLRLKLINLLMEGERNVTNLVELSGASQANVSRHLSSLTRAGILRRRKEGLNVFYEIADRSVFELCDLVCGSVEEFHRKQFGVFFE